MPDKVFHIEEDDGGLVEWIQDLIDTDTFAWPCDLKVTVEDVTPSEDIVVKQFTAQLPRK